MTAMTGHDWFSYQSVSKERLVVEIECALFFLASVVLSLFVLKLSEEITLV
jgi:hypothetical protein